MTDGLKDAHREAIIAAIADNDRVERAVLFGSRATGTNTVTSDVDIALFGDRLTLTDQARLSAAIDEIPMAQSVDLMLHDSVSDRTLRAHIRREGIEWYAQPRSTHADRKSWPMARLGDHAESCLGKMLDQHKNRGELLPYLGNKNVRWGSFDTRELGRMRFEAHEHDRYGLKYGDLVVCEGGEPGRCAIWKDELPGMKIQKALHRIRARDQLDNRFLHYWFLLAGRNGALEPYFTGTTIKHLTGKAISELQVPLPPLPEQCAIAHVLGTLDDKIELNRWMNGTLEAMARALFKSWFVDFDPVRAKMEGRDTGLAQDVADLFPDRLVDSEVGEIPEGWEASSLGEVAALRRKGTDPASEASDTPYIGLADMPRGSIALTDWGRLGSVSSRKSAFRAGDILFGKLRPYFHKVGIAPVDGFCSTDIVVLSARRPQWSSFVLACVSSSAFVAHTSQTATGTKMPRTSWRAMSGYDLCRPTDAMASGFQRIVSPMLGRIVGNIHESRTLAALRDALLPKLISGEIRASAAERLVEAVP